MAEYASLRQRPYDYDEPYKPLPRPQGGSAVPTTTKQKACGWWVGGEWIEQPPPKSDKPEQRSRLSPVIIDDGDDSDCYEVPPPVPQTAKASRASRSGRVFDFNNSEQALTWVTRRDDNQNYQVRSFADYADDELLSYLAERSISRGFLQEIDQFLCGHPEIANCPEGRETILQLNTLPPLEAYKYFLRGYTRPARYVDGVVKSEYFTLPANYPYQPLRTKIDPELVNFFEGFEYRWDIIDRIDQAVRGGIHELSLGRPLPSGYQRLICYALWGNPSDAYKWYEYSLQEEYLPHRYLPEHVVLGHVSKLVGEADPQPSSLNTSRCHMDVRFRMARANDEGIDVLEVLLTEFKGALIRSGFRRIDIDNMYEQAKDRLENERRYPTGVDIVDLVMDEIPAHSPAHSPAHGLYIEGNQYTRPDPNQFAFNAAASRSGRKRRNNRVLVKNVPTALRAQAAELCSARTNLERAYKQEQNVQDLSSRCKGVTFNAARARAERRYINCLIRYLRDSNQMNPVEATQMQAKFTRRKMEQARMSNRVYLLGMYPHELK